MSQEKLDLYAELRATMHSQVDNVFDFISGEIEGSPYEGISAEKYNEVQNFTHFISCAILLYGLLVTNSAPAAVAISLMAAEEHLDSAYKSFEELSAIPNDKDNTDNTDKE